MGWFLGGVRQRKKKKKNEKNSKKNAVNCKYVRGFSDVRALKTLSKTCVLDRRYAQKRVNYGVFAMKHCKNNVKKKKNEIVRAFLDIFGEPKNLRCGRPPHAKGGDYVEILKCELANAFVSLCLLTCKLGDLACTSGRFRHGTGPKAFGTQHLEKCQQKFTTQSFP